MLMALARARIVAVLMANASGFLMALLRWSMTGSGQVLVSPLMVTDTFTMADPSGRNMAGAPFHSWASHLASGSILSTSAQAQAHDK